MKRILETKLIPCPICGAKPIWNLDRIQCPNCEIMIFGTGKRLTMSVMLKWNASMQQGCSFAAYCFPDCGWCVLSPWIKSKDGSPYRLHCSDNLKQREAEHLAQELNRVSRNKEYREVLYPVEYAELGKGMDKDE